MNDCNFRSSAVYLELPLIGLDTLLLGGILSLVLKRKRLSLSSIVFEATVATVGLDKANQHKSDVDMNVGIPMIWLFQEVMPSPFYDLCARICII